jgi:hypothetical protein
MNGAPGYLIAAALFCLSAAALGKGRKCKGALTPGRRHFVGCLALRVVYSFAAVGSWIA